MSFKLLNRHRIRADPPTYPVTIQEDIYNSSLPDGSLDSTRLQTATWKKIILYIDELKTQGYQVTEPKFTHEKQFVTFQIVARRHDVEQPRM